MKVLAKTPVVLILLWLVAANIIIEVFRHMSHILLSPSGVRVLDCLVLFIALIDIYIYSPQSYRLL